MGSESSISIWKGTESERVRCLTMSDFLLVVAEILGSGNTVSEQIAYITIALIKTMSTDSDRSFTSSSTVGVDVTQQVRTLSPFVI